MENRDVQVVIAVILAGIVGFALATFLMNDDDEPATVETAATTVEETVPTAPAPTQPANTTTVPAPTGTDPEQAPQEGPNDADCIEIWNQDNNAAPQSFLADLQNRQAVRVNVAATPNAPQKCLVTLIANDGGVYRFTEGAAAAFPYSPRPTRLQLSALAQEERATDALPETGGKLTAR